jgi:hypothetical protein
MGGFLECSGQERVPRGGGHGGPPLQYVPNYFRKSRTVERTVGAALRGRPCVEPFLIPQFT